MGAWVWVGYLVFSFFSIWDGFCYIWSLAHCLYFRRGGGSTLPSLDPRWALLEFFFAELRD